MMGRFAWLQVVGVLVAPFFGSRGVHEYLAEGYNDLSHRSLELANEYDRKRIEVVAETEQKGGDPV